MRSYNSKMKLILCLYFISFYFAFRNVDPESSLSLSTLEDFSSEPIKQPKGQQKRDLTDKSVEESKNNETNKIKKTFPPNLEKVIKIQTHENSQESVSTEKISVVVKIYDQMKNEEKSKPEFQSILTLPSAISDDLENDSVEKIQTEGFSDKKSEKIIIQEEPSNQLIYKTVGEVVGKDKNTGLESLKVPFEIKGETSIQITPEKENIKTQTQSQLSEKDNKITLEEFSKRYFPDLDFLKPNEEEMKEISAFDDKLINFYESQIKQKAKSENEKVKQNRSLSRKKSKNPENDSRKILMEQNNKNSVKRRNLMGRNNLIDKTDKMQNEVLKLEKSGQKNILRDLTLEKKEDSVSLFPSNDDKTNDGGILSKIQSIFGSFSEQLLNLFPTNEKQTNFETENVPIVHRSNANLRNINEIQSQLNHIENYVLQTAIKAQKENQKAI